MMIKTQQRTDTIQEGNLYGNIEVYSPDDILMFYASAKRMHFYLKNDLAEEIGDDKFRLKFQPKGLGWGTPDGKRYLCKRDNCCVVTGSTENLTRHHIVPILFRRHFPSEFNSNFQVVVLIDIDKHREYTIKEQKFYDILALKYDIPEYKTFNKVIRNETRVSCIVNIMRNNKNLPKQRLTELELEFMHHTGLACTQENFNKFIRKKPFYVREELSIENDFGMALVSKITDFREFELLWLNHFIEEMKPKFLPKDLILMYDLKLDLVNSEK